MAQARSRNLLCSCKEATNSMGTNWFPNEKHGDISQLVSTLGPRWSKHKLLLKVEQERET